MNDYNNCLPSEVRAGVEIALEEMLRLRPKEEFNFLCEMLDLDAPLDSAKADKISRICATVVCDAELPEGKGSLVTNVAIYTWLRGQMAIIYLSEQRQCANQFSDRPIRLK